MPFLSPDIRDRGKQGLRVGMAALLIDGLPPVAEMLDDPQVMGDKQVGQVKFLFDILHHV